MNAAIDILRAELERLFSLDELTSMSERILGLDPGEVGGVTAKATLRARPRRALPRRRPDRRAGRRHPRVEARRRPSCARRRRLVRQRRASGKGRPSMPFTGLRKLGESELAIVYAARRGDEDRILKVLRPEATETGARCSGSSRRRVSRRTSCTKGCPRGSRRPRRTACTG